MAYVLLMSTDNNIVNVQLSPGWPNPNPRFQWAQLSPGGLNIPNGATIVVIAHGNNREIGNEHPGTIDIGAEAFLAIVHSNMAANAAPGAVYISACSGGIAEFAARVALVAAQNQVWQNTSIYGHADAVIGPVPNPTSIAWFRIYPDSAQGQPALGGSRTDLADTSTGGALQDPPAGTWPPLALSTPAAAAAAYNVPAVKHYVVNETGNIMMATTQTADGVISPAASALFQEVAVFFAAMTKAITTTPKPGAKQPYAPTDYYTIYDYQALENIVNGSGMFVNVQREDMSFTTKQVTATFNIEFIEAVLGVALTDGIGAAPLMAALNAMGKQLTLSYSKSTGAQKIGHLLFVCEYLMGMPLVSVLYFYLDEAQATMVFEASPCIKVVDKSFTLALHKDTFMFVPPAWIRQYGGDLASVQEDAAYQQLINQLRALITNAPMVTAVSGGSPGTPIASGTKVTLTGVNFGSSAGKIYVGGVEQTVQTGWTATAVAFSAVNATGQAITAPIVVVTGGGSSTYTAEEYTLASS